MLIWCGLMFLLGVMAFCDSFFNYGMVFRQVNSLVYMLLSLGVLARVYRKSRDRYWEHLVMRKLGLENHAVGGSGMAMGDADSMMDEGVREKNTVGA